MYKSEGFIIRSNGNVYLHVDEGEFLIQFVNGEPTITKIPSMTDHIVAGWSTKK